MNKLICITKRGSYIDSHEINRILCYWHISLDDLSSMCRYGMKMFLTPKLVECKNYKGCWLWCRWFWRVFIDKDVTTMLFAPNMKLRFNFQILNLSPQKWPTKDIILSLPWLNTNFVKRKLLTLKKKITFKQKSTQFVDKYQILF